VAPKNQSAKPKPISVTEINLKANGGMDLLPARIKTKMQKFSFDATSNEDTKCCCLMNDRALKLLSMREKHFASLKK